MTADEASLRGYRDALMSALAGGDGVSDGDPVLVLSRVVRDARGAGHDASVEALGEVAAASGLDEAVRAAAARFGSPWAFREAVYFARCLGREPAGALRLLAFRRYAQDATISDDLPDLFTDQAAVLNTSTFESAWADQGRIGWMLDNLQSWRRDFIFVYHARHASHRALTRDVTEAVEALLPKTEAVARLNGLDGLGPPLGVDAIAGVLDLAPLEACELDGELLADALETQPSCPRCDYVLGQQAASVEVQRLRAAIERALADQQTRLAQRVVSKLLLQPVNGGGERLQRFIQVVQASDLTGLALVLDDGLIEFLRELLQGDLTPTPLHGDGEGSSAPPALSAAHDGGTYGAGVLERLAVVYPEVTTENLDAAVGELRRLLQDEVSHGGVVRLRDPSTSSGQAPSAAGQ